MDKNEIRKAIDINNKLIQRLMDKFDFTLNDNLNAILKTNEEIRAKCNHEFEDGICKWCDEIEVNI